jgi:hypothetical protein
VSAAGDERYRWTPGEYALRAELLPLRELVVEGAADRALFTDFTRRHGLAAEVFDASFFSVSTDEAERAGGKHGVKGSLLALAAALTTTRARLHPSSRLAVVVDRDYDGPPPDELSWVVYVTDGYSAENYALTRTALDRFGRLVLGFRAERSVDLYSSVIGACCDLASARLAVRAMLPGRGLFDRWIDYVRIDGDGRAELERERLIQNTSDSSEMRQRLEERVREEDGRVAMQPNVWVRGRDFVRVLHKVLKSGALRRMSDLRFAKISEETLTLWLLLGVDPRELDGWPLFDALLERFAT